MVVVVVVVVVLELHGMFHSCCVGSPVCCYLAGLVRNVVDVDSRIWSRTIAVAVVKVTVVVSTIY